MASSVRSLSVPLTSTRGYQHYPLISPSSLSFCLLRAPNRSNCLSLSVSQDTDWGLSKRCCQIVCASRSGLEASITEPNENSLKLKGAKIVVVSRDEKEIKLRVDLNGDETQKAFNMTLRDLARTAPPVPGFRKQKGGKTTGVPQSFLLQILGEERVTKFVIQEIVTTTIFDYVEKENLNVKEKKFNTIQSEEELKRLFAPGKEFGFDAALELEVSETETLAPTPLDV